MNAIEEAKVHWDVYAVIMKKFYREQIEQNLLLIEMVYEDIRIFKTTG
jgi:hypothetical protein